MAIFRSMSVRRLLLLCVVALATVVWANVAFAQYPGGSRNSDEWHACFTQRTNNGAWSALGCEHLLWYPSTGGGASPQSQNWEASTHGSATFPVVANNQEVWTYIVPPAGVMSYTYSCGFQVQRCFDNGITGSSNATVSTGGPGSNPFNDDDTRFNFGYPSSIVANECFLSSGSVVGRWRASAFDNFSTLEPVAGWTGSPTSNYPSFRAAAGSESRYRNTLAQYSCRIIDYDMHGSLPIWEPDIGDLVPGPTPTPGPGWDTDPWIPATPLPISFVITETTTECTEFLPSFEQSAGVYSYTVGVDVNPYEICFEQYAVDLQFMGWNFATLGLAVAFIMAFSVLYKIFKSGG